jgi:hypothetical protein
MSNSSAHDFILDRISPTPNGAQWITLLISQDRFNVMDIVREVKVAHRLCQTITAEYAQQFSHSKVIEMISGFTEMGAVVILTCENMHELSEFVPYLSTWQDKQTSRKIEGKATDGRLFVLLNNTSTDQINEEVQNLFDYTWALN